MFVTVVLACSRLMGGIPKEDHVNAGEQIKALGLLKREFQAIRAVWSRQCDLLHVYDEIRMAKFTYDITNETGMLLNIESSAAEVRFKQSKAILGLPILLKKIDLFAAPNSTVPRTKYLHLLQIAVEVRFPAVPQKFGKTLREGRKCGGILPRVPQFDGREGN